MTHQEKTYDETEHEQKQVKIMVSSVDILLVLRASREAHYASTWQMRSRRAGSKAGESMTL